ncbi:hypothetical protein [Psychroserpens damuponensis]|uniref:hypothetical protein n=1 Tax=Psychroserpens damuponensis TaxID=943936 RepID=UPI00058B9CDA|nr:hypothetical protein [Psychroserpens damuponensis]
MNISNNILLFLVFLTTSLFGQTGEKLIESHKAERIVYSDSSKLKVYDNRGKHIIEDTKVAIYVNGNFLNASILKTLNPNKIKSLSVEKDSITIGDDSYLGKILIKLVDDYEPKFMALKKFISNHFVLNDLPQVFQLNETILNVNSQDFLIDEQFIMMVSVEEIITSEENLSINLIKLITKTEDNIKKGNTIIIK